MDAAAGLGLPAALQAFAAALAEPVAAGAELLLVVAHPDDETIGLGGQLGRLRRMPIICLTDGAPADLRDAQAHGFAGTADYAAARRAELVAALGIAGYPEAGLLCLDIPDQETARHLVPLARRLAGILAERRPRFVLTHAYEGGHPDHDAAAFAIAAAAKLLRRTELPAPTIIEMPFYHAAPEGIVCQRFAPGFDLPEATLSLGPGAAAAKAAMIACHGTQSETLASFSCDIERFRLAPGYDFRAPPNGGRLQYERWRLGLTGDEWLALAGRALTELERGK